MTNSPKANLFLALQAYIAGLTDGSGNPYFQSVDQDMGQLDVPNRPPLAFPCVLIDISEFKYEKLALNAQSGVGTVVIRMGFTPFSSASSITGQAYQEMAIYYYDLEQLLYQALQGWCPGNQAGYSSLQNIYGILSRLSDHTEHRADKHIRIRQINYRLTMEDYSDQLPQATAAPTGNLSQEMLTP